MHQKYFIGGVPIFTRTLPSGDMTVWHPFNLGVQQIVEPICRGRGYWQPGYNNWVIKAACVEQVRADLAKMGGAT